MIDPHKRWLERKKVSLVHILPALFGAVEYHNHFSQSENHVCPLPSKNYLFSLHFTRSVCLYFAPPAFNLPSNFILSMYPLFSFLSKFAPFFLVPLIPFSKFFPEWHWPIFLPLGRGEIFQYIHPWYLVGDCSFSRELFSLEEAQKRGKIIPPPPNTVLQNFSQNFWCHLYSGRYLLYRIVWWNLWPPPHCAKHKN